MFCWDFRLKLPQVKDAKPDSKYSGLRNGISMYLSVCGMI